MRQIDRSAEMYKMSRKMRQSKKDSRHFVQGKSTKDSLPGGAETIVDEQSVAVQGPKLNSGDFTTADNVAHVTDSVHDVSAVHVKYEQLRTLNQIHQTERKLARIVRDLYMRRPPFRNARYNFS